MEYSGTDLELLDTHFYEMVKATIRQTFINRVGPFKVVDLLHQADENVLTQDEIEEIKKCTRDKGNFAGAEELLERLSQYEGWFHCLTVVLWQALPDVATAIGAEHDQLMHQYLNTKFDEKHLIDGKGCVCLFIAAKRGHNGCVEDLIKNKSDTINLNKQNQNGETAMYLAAAEGQSKCLELLIQAGADVNLQNNDRESPLFAAAKNGYDQCVQALTKAGGRIQLVTSNSKGFPPAYAAAARGHPKCLQLLVDAGIRVNDSFLLGRLDCITLLMIAVYGGDEKCVEILVDAGADIKERDRYGRTALFIAAMEMKSKCLEVLIKAGADINARSTNSEKLTALMIAAFYRQIDSVRVLLSAGADVHLTNAAGQTALMLAASTGDEESLLELIRAGSNLNIQDKNGKTALILAAVGTFDICVQILVENGADVHLRDKEGKSAVHYSAHRFGLALTILIEIGVDINAADDSGFTPLMVAAKKCCVAAERYLIRKGADINKVNKLGLTALQIAELTEVPEQAAAPIREQMVYLRNCSKGTTAMPQQSVQAVTDADVSKTSVTVDQCNDQQEFGWSFGPEDSLQDNYKDCLKNPGHLGFIPVTELRLSHLPHKYREQKVLDVINAEAELTVRLLVNYTSTDRPDGYPAWPLRGKKRRRVGSGWINVAMAKFTAEDKEKCPCPVCETSGDPKMEWGKLRITTAMHVVYDSSEAKKTVVHIFADVDKPDEMHKLYGYDMEYFQLEEDYCSILVATHDLCLWNYLKSMSEHRTGIWAKCKGAANKFVAIVSHPHGCSKQVTMGEWTERHRCVGTDHVFKYIYNVPTCPGSSGAPVIVFGREAAITHHPHSGSHTDPGLNLSGAGSDNDTFHQQFEKPGVFRYWKGGRLADHSTQKLMPFGWNTLVAPIEKAKPSPPVQPLYDFQQRPQPN